LGTGGVPGKFPWNLPFIARYTGGHGVRMAGRAVSRQARFRALMGWFANDSLSL